MDKLSALGVDAVFLPSEGDMYKSGHSHYIVPEGFSESGEGAVR